MAFDITRLCANSPAMQMQTPRRALRIEGLDVDGLAARVGNDPAVVGTVLRRFAESQREAADGLAALISVDPEAARGRAHDLKGMLGNIGATELYQTAAALNALLREGQSDGAPTLARALEHGIPRLCRAIEQSVPAAKMPPGSTVGGGDTEAFAERLAWLARNLKTGRAREARNILDELVGAEIGDAEQALLAKIAPLVSAYRLREAAALLADAGHG
jgi:HPt (histidine-containing phosphotransfer) domain-containing protein